MANTPKSDDTPAAAELAKSAAHWRRRSPEFTVKAKATKDPVEKVLFQRSATSADALASHFERALAEGLSKSAA